MYNGFIVQIISSTMENYFKPLSGSHKIGGNECTEDSIKNATSQSSIKNEINLDDSPKTHFKISGKQKQNLKSNRKLSYNTDKDPKLKVQRPLHKSKVIQCSDNIDGKEMYSNTAQSDESLTLNVGNDEKSFRKMSKSVKSSRSSNPKKKSKKSESEAAIVASGSSSLRESNSPPVSDAFRVMMDSRHKAIGTNSPGKIADKEECPKDKEAIKLAKVNRKLLMEKWAEDKGAKRKRQKQVDHDVYIKQVLKKRAKTFKEMLVKGDDICTNVNKKGSKSNLSVLPKISKCNKRAINSDGKKCSNSEKLNDKEYDSKDTVKHNYKDTSRNAAKLKNAVYPPVIESGNSSQCGLAKKKVSFLDKLSPPLKKKESVLSYFDKIDNDVVSPNSMSDVKNDDSNEFFNDIGDDNSSCFLEEESNSQIFKIKITRKVKLSKHRRKNKKRKKAIGNIKKSAFHETKGKINEVTEDCDLTSNKRKLKSPMVKKVIHTMNDNDYCCETSESNTAPDVMRPRRNIRRPLKYLDGSEDSRASSDSEELNIFSSINNCDPIQSKRKGCIKRFKERVNKENLTSEKTKNQLKNKFEPVKSLTESSCEVECIDDIPLIKCREPLSLREQPSPPDNLKIAPLFMKKKIKVSVDPSLLAAKQMFLQSGIPDAIRKQQKKIASCVIDLKIFPCVSHIQQIPQNCESIFNPWNLPDVDDARLKSDLCIESDETSCIGSVADSLHHESKEMKLMSSEDCAEVRSYDLLSQLKYFDCKEGLHKIKCSYPNFPVYKTFKLLYQKKSGSNDVDCLDSNRIFNENISNDSRFIECLLWTDKYKPASSDDIIGNVNGVRLIKTWLESWKGYNEMTYNKISKRKREDSDSSIDLFESESRDSVMPLDNTMVIIGPRGSGKTCSIYAVANELGINVLEVNASSKRTGRIMISTAQCDTHKVLIKRSSEYSVNNFSKLLDSAGNKKETMKSISKNSQSFKIGNGKKLPRKKRKRPSLSSSTDGLSQSSTVETDKKSLMLIEDADIVFEEDDGFVAAISQIVLSSKIPIIIVASDHKCNHLERFMTESNVIRFRPLSGKLLGPWLDVMMLLECGTVVPKLSSSLLDYNKGDIRMTTLQLQYWMHGTKRPSYSQENKITETDQNDHLDINDETDQRLFYSIEGDSNTSFNNVKFNFFSGSEERKISGSVPSEVANVDVALHNMSDFGDFDSLFSRELMKFIDVDKVWWDMNILYDCCENKHTEEWISVSNLKAKSSITHCIPHKNIDLSIMSDCLDNLSATDLMQNYCKAHTNELHISQPWQYGPVDGLSEAEDFSEFHNFKELSTFLSQTILKYSVECLEKHKCINTTTLDNMKTKKINVQRWQQTNEMVYNKLCEAISIGSQLDRRSVSVDYLPSLRNICRSEKERSENNFRRNKRFYHHLRTLNISANDRVFDSACQGLNIS